MTDGQSEFGSCRLIETFSAKVAMPGHPTVLDDPIKAVGVMRAEDIPRSLVRVGLGPDLFIPLSSLRLAKM